MKSISLQFCALFLAFFLSATSAGQDIGSIVPEIALPSLDNGEIVRLSDLGDKIVYIDFWASWCGPCRRSLPELEQIRAEYEDYFEVYAINLDEDLEDARRFLDSIPVSYPVVRDSDATFPELFGVMGMPTSYIIDGEGVLRYVHQGYRKGDDKKIREYIKRLIDE